MSVVGEFSVEDGEFPLSGVLEGVPGVRIELERIVPVSERRLPFFWVWGDFDAVDDLAAADPTVESLRRIDEVDGGALYRAVWREEAGGVIDAVVDADATLLEGVGDRDGWRFVLRFDDTDAISAFQRHCLDAGVGVTLERLHTLDDRHEEPRYGLTALQRNTIAAAFRAGYFDDPRDTTLQEMSDDFGVTPRAVSKRINRGLSRLIANTLLDDPGSTWTGRA